MEGAESVAAVQVLRMSVYMVMDAMNKRKTRTNDPAP